MYIAYIDTYAALVFSCKQHLGLVLKKSTHMCGFGTITHKNKKMFLCFELTNNHKKVK